MVLGNCGAWIAYSLVVANPYVFWANAPGFLCGLFMFSSSVKLCATPHDRTVLEGLALGFGGVLLATAYATSMVLTTHSARANLCVAVANLFTFSFYAAPLSSMGTVFRAKNSASLSLPLLAMALVNSALWTSYGLSLKDMGMVVPNGAGVVLSALQLAVYFAFRQPKGVAK
jgi:solute carrier family 50 protein (sugar transporter)